MELNTSIYKVGDIPKELIAKLEQDYNDLAKILDLDTYWETMSTEGYFEILDEYPVPTTLSDNVILGIQRFSTNVLGQDIPDISQRYIPDERTLQYLLNIRRLLAEQLEYSGISGIEEEGCERWFAVASINGQPYGGIYIFWNKLYPDQVVMQGISKLLIPSLFTLLYPEQEKRLPRLNTLLQPAVETVANGLGAKYVYVAPIGRQGDILKKHYGFHETGKFTFPCKMIRGSEEIMHTHESEMSKFQNMYMKEI